MKLYSKQKLLDFYNHCKSLRFRIFFLSRQQFQMAISYIEVLFLVGLVFFYCWYLDVFLIKE